MENDYLTRERYINMYIVVQQSDGETLNLEGLLKQMLDRLDKLEKPKVDGFSQHTIEQHIGRLYDMIGEINNQEPEAAPEVIDKLTAQIHQIQDLQIKKALVQGHDGIAERDKAIAALEDRLEVANRDVMHKEAERSRLRLDRRNQDEIIQTYRRYVAFSYHQGMPRPEIRIEMHDKLCNLGEMEHIEAIQKETNDE